jgi:hypothetical protein
MKKLLILVSFLFISFLSLGQGWYKQMTSATSGTVTIVDASTNIVVIHTGSLTTSLTFAFPATPFDGQRVTIASNNGITTISLTTGVGSILNALTTLAAGASATYIYDLASTKWCKI